MWIALAIAAAAFVVATLLAPKPKIENARAASLDDFAFPRSNEGDPLPIVKGTVKQLSPNTIGMMGFRTAAITKKVKTGLFSSKRQTVGYRYYIGLDLALALGPGVRLRRIWFGDEVAWTGDIGGSNSSAISVFRHADYGGTTQSYSGPVTNIVGGLANNISSLRVQGSWDVFTGPNFTGSMLTVTGDVSNLAGTPFQDSIASMRPTPGVDPSASGVSIAINDPNFHGGDENGNGGIAGTLTFYGGSMDQAQDPYLAQHLGAQVPCYHGMSHIVLKDFYVGNSPNIDAVKFELQCFTNKLGLTGGRNIMPNGLDENPLETLYDIYTTFWGKLGVDPANIDVDSFRDAANRVYSEKNGYSLSLANANTGGDITKEIIRQINAIMYQDIETAQIRIKLIRPDYNVDTLPVLRPTNIVELTNYTKQLWDETYNQVRVKYKHRANNYADGVALWQDFANINMQQRVRSTEVSFPGVYEPELANQLAAREGSQLNVPLFQCDFEADRTVSNLRPGDCFVLFWPEYGIKRTVMRIRKFDTGELANGKISVMCVQDEFSADNVVFSTPSSSLWAPADLTPDPILTHAVFAAPHYFKLMAEPAGATGERLFALARRPDAQSQAYNIYTSLAPAAPTAATASQVQFSGAGALESAYPASAGATNGYDETVGFTVTNTDKVFTPEIHSDAEIKQNGQNLIYVGGEIMAYRLVEALPDGSYRLTNIRRGLLDTAIISHAANAPVFFLSSIDGMADAEFKASDSVLAKLQDLAPQGEYPLTSAATIGPVAMDSRSERPAPPVQGTYQGVRTGSAARSATAVLAWRERNRLDPVVRFRDEATQAVESGQDNRVRWRINAGAWNTVTVAGPTTVIDTSAANVNDLLNVEITSRRAGLDSRVSDTFQIVLT